MVLRDKLIDLVHVEGGFTERVKMVMYFLFMFRDHRYREFICRVVADKNGKWNASIFSDTHSEFFKGVGGRKAFTNLRQFLSQTGNLDEGSWSVQMPDIDRWFPDAVQIAVDSIGDSKARKSFVVSPHGFLIRYRMNALLNATPQELSQLEFGGTYEESDDLMPPIELPQLASRIDAADLRRWDRTTPSSKNRELLTIEIDPIALERANYQHFLLEERINKLCTINGLIPMTSKYVDLVVDCGEKSILFEMKSCSPLSIRGQVRRAISQLLEYRFLYRDKLNPEIVACAVVERKPEGRLTWMIEYLESLGIGLIWKNPDKLSCTDFTRGLLATILPETRSKAF